jgi:hypothetical protein
VPTLAPDASTPAGGRAAGSRATETLVAETAGQDLDGTRTERWWGDPAVVRPDQLADR